VKEKKKDLPLGGGLKNDFYFRSSFSLGGKIDSRIEKKKSSPRGFSDVLVYLACLGCLVGACFLLVGCPAVWILGFTVYFRAGSYGELGGLFVVGPGAWSDFDC